MITHFITTEIDLQADTALLKKTVEAELSKHGEPLRWAITAVDSNKGKVIVEAVVTEKDFK